MDFRESWYFPERPQNTSLDIIGTRIQYGLKHHLTSTVHEIKCDTLHSPITEISFGDKYKLCDKFQYIVLLSRTKLGSNIIFVGKNWDTINSLCSIIKTPTKWVNYMDYVLDISYINKREENT